MSITSKVKSLFKSLLGLEPNQACRAEAKRRQNDFRVLDDDPYRRAVVERCLKEDKAIFARVDEDGNLIFESEKE